MAVAYSNSVFAQSNGTTANATLSISGSDRAVIVGLKTFGGPTVSNPLFEGVAMTTIVADTTNDLYLYYLLNPPTGSRTANITMSAANEWGLLVVSLTGVHQTVPIGTAAQNQNSEVSPISASATGVTDGLVLDFVQMVAFDLTPGVGQTRYPTSAPNGDSYFGGAVCIGMSVKSGTGSVAMSWSTTESFGDNAIIAVPILPSAGGGGGPVRNQSLMLMGVG